MPKVLEAELPILHRVQAQRPSLHGKAETWLGILKPPLYLHRTPVNSSQRQNSYQKTPWVVKRHQKKTL